MSRYIDADALIDFIDVEHLRHPSELCFSEIDVVNLLLHAPTADVAPVVHAIWKNCGEGDGDWYCTNCKQWQTFDEFGDLHPKDDYDYYYCPNCGAKMRCDNEQE